MSAQEKVTVVLSKDEALFPSEPLSSLCEARYLGFGDEEAKQIPNEPLCPPEKVARRFVPGCGEALTEAGAREGRLW